MESERSVQIAWVVRFVVNTAFRRQPISPQANPGDSGPVCSIPPKTVTGGVGAKWGWCCPTLEFTPNDTTKRAEKCGSSLLNLDVFCAEKC